MDHFAFLYSNFSISLFSFIVLFLFIGDMHKHTLSQLCQTSKRGNVQIKKTSFFSSTYYYGIRKYRLEKFEISYRFQETYVMSWRKFFRDSRETAMALDALKITRSRQTMFLEFTITRGYLFAVCYRNRMQELLRVPLFVAVNLPSCPRYSTDWPDPT